MIVLQYNMLSNKCLSFSGSHKYANNMIKKVDLRTYL